LRAFLSVWKTGKDDDDEDRTEALKDEALKGAVLTVRL
jgi:hypothetical protein